MTNIIRDGWIVRMERALELLADRIDAPPALAELAGAAGVSPFHFHRLWRALTGETVGQTIARLRIAAAQHRLAAGAGSITDVAMEGGYGTSQSFARAFRRVAGMSPSAFLSEGVSQLATGSPATAQVRIDMRAEQRLVAVRREGGAYRELNALFWQLWSWAEESGKMNGLLGIYGIPLDDPLSVAESALRYDACLALADPGAPPPPLKLVTVPSGAYAVLRHDGSYEALEDSNQRLIDWVIATGREPAEFPLFHHFIDDPEEVAEADLRTDILLPLAMAEGGSATVTNP